LVDLDALRKTAQANGTYYPPGQCPPAGQAGVVFVESSDCVYLSNSTWNSATAPGALIFASGTVQFNGTLNFYGVVYMANGQGNSPTSGPCTPPLENGPVFEVHGTGTVFGAIFVDKCGIVDAGSSAFNIQYDSNAFSGVTAYATPALARNTFRIVAHP
jgi:hypothetical protein